MDSSSVGSSSSKTILRDEFSAVLGETFALQNANIEIISKHRGNLTRTVSFQEKVKLTQEIQFIVPLSIVKNHCEKFVAVAFQQSSNGYLNFNTHFVYLTQVLSGHRWELYGSHINTEYTQER